MKRGPHFMDTDFKSVILSLPIRPGAETALHFSFEYV